jgi:lysophospholipase L1-like esterase
MLEQQGIEVNHSQIIARTGWTTGELLEAIQAERPRGPFHLVTVLIGVNNQYRGQSIDLYRQEFRQLLELAVEFAANDVSRVLVLSIPDWGVTPFAADRDQDRIAREIDLFNQVNREETELVGAVYIDITELSREAAGDPSLVAPDGLHPSGAMHRQWAQLVWNRWSVNRCVGELVRWWAG